MNYLANAVFVIALSGLFLIASCQKSNESDVLPTSQGPISIQVDTVFMTDTLHITDTLRIVDTLLVQPPVNRVDNHLSLIADKMNVLYLGVENPLTVHREGGSGDVRLNADGLGIKSVGTNKFTVSASRPGEVTVTVSEEGGRKNFPFRVKRIPDPQARLNSSAGGSIGSGEFKAQGGVGAFLDDFDFEARCAIEGFTLTYVAKRGDAIESINRGPRYNTLSRRLIGNAKPGDIYAFTNVKAKCPGDAAGRMINSMVFTIK